MGAIFAGVGLAGNIASGILGSNAASSASQAQVASAQQAMQLIQQFYGKSQNNEQPFLNFGENAASTLQGENSWLTSPINPSVATLQNLPGYQFTLGQGLQATQNGFAAQGLGSSGAAIKGAGNYATGLAESNWNNFFNQQLQNRQLSAGILQNQVNTGAGAANTLTNAAMSAGQSLAGLETGIGNAQASGIVGSTNAITGAISGAGNNILTGTILNNLGGANSGGGLFGPSLPNNSDMGLPNNYQGGPMANT